MRLLVIRTSAMGDVALTTPVLSALTRQYPDSDVLLLTRQSFKPFFYSIERLKLFYADLGGRHKGLSGLLRLFRDITGTGRIDIVIDLHDVLRSRVIRFLFRLKGIPSYVIDKGRAEKRGVISGKRKIKLKHSVLRYSDTFAKAGFPLKLAHGPWIIPDPAALSKIEPVTGAQTKMLIGVAPYAKHKLKIWPEEYLLRLLGMISEKYKASYFLFGGIEDSERLSALHVRLPGSFNSVGNLDLDEELALMSRLDIMIAMDSSNMHMAALTGVKVISIWGGTDPVTGFGGWMQPEDYSVRISIDDLTCRPCTVYGKGECKRGDFACMNWMTPEIVFKKIDKLLLADYELRRSDN
jgi:ADP-heptose:LPS heptosyltransferase